MKSTTAIRDKSIDDVENVLHGFSEVAKGNDATFTGRECKLAVISRTHHGDGEESA